MLLQMSEIIDVIAKLRRFIRHAHSIKVFWRQVMICIILVKPDANSIILFILFNFIVRVKTL